MRTHGAAAYLVNILSGSARFARDQRFGFCGKYPKRFGFCGLGLGLGLGLQHVPGLGL